MRLLRDEEHVDRWLEAEGLSRGASIEPRALWRLAKAWYEDRLEPDWRRRTPEEAEQIFARMGLTGDFWRMT